MPGLEQSKPLRKMGMHSSPTGELFLTDVRVGRDGSIGETEEAPPVAGRGQGHVLDGALRRRRDGARHHRAVPRALVDYARNRVQFGQPIGEFQLIQDKLGEDGGGPPQRPEPRVPPIEMARRPVSLTLAEASAMKLYSARAATEVARGGAALRRQRLHDRVPRRAARRDAKVLQIYAGTDEIQITHIAKDLREADCSGLRPG